MTKPQFSWNTGLCLFLLLQLGCAGTEKTTEGKEEAEREPFIIVQTPDEPTGMRLAKPSPKVQSIQLFRGPNETLREVPLEMEIQFPVLPPGGSQALHLEFDLMEGRGRPLTAYFYHANAKWQRDLLPVEYMEVFQREDLLNYTPSRATDIPYTHYSYQFPNQSIQFGISGNYILRISEQGREDEVLFERPFYVTEQNVPLQLGIENILIGEGGFGAIQPVARFRPRDEMQGGVFDFTVCFVRNGRFASPRCTDQPHLAEQPSLRFYIERDEAFQPVAADFYLDLSFLRIGRQIEEIDHGSRPPVVRLEPDYARFAGNTIAPILNGQAAIASSVRDVVNPHFTAEYALVQFSFVPENQQLLEKDVHVIGSFNEWLPDESNVMTWSFEREQYEAELLIKQGQYDYRYYTGPRAGIPRGSVPRVENLYTAFVYFHDLHRRTDRLIALGSFLGQ